MSRTTERIIDLIALMLLLLYTYMIRDSQPTLAGAVVVDAIQFWMVKNASSPDSPAHKEAVTVAEAAASRALAAAEAAAQVLKTANEAAAQVLKAAGALAPTKGQEAGASR